MENVQAFWSSLSVVLAEIDGMADEAAAETLIDYLERYREGWTAIAASMHASAGRRALVERGVQILAQRDMVDDGIPSG
jgi:hypothetical protein